jgi:hypothetical protein
MSVKPWAGFIADFPDDEIESGGGQMEIRGGRNVAVALGEILTGLGCQVSAPDYAGLKGWEFDLYDQERRRFWCQITSFHPAFYLLFEDPAITRGTRAKNATAYAELWRKLADALDNDPRFHDVEWRSNEEGPPNPEEIGEIGARERTSQIPSAPIEAQFRPEPPRPVSTFGCVLMMAAAFLFVIGAADAISSIVKLIRGRPGYELNLIMDLPFVCLGGLGLWALMRKPRRHQKV